MADILPAIFFGHGNPMNALMNNPYTEAWQRIGKDTARPRAIVSISAHWFALSALRDRYAPTGRLDYLSG